jgi:hypothetical protein
MGGAVASHGALDADKQRPDNGLCVYAKTGVSNLDESARD